MELQTNVKTGDLKISEGSSPAVVTQPVVTKEPDLVTKVSQVKLEEPIVKEPEFDFKDIEAIADPVAKEQALKAYKSFQKGFNQKFQEIAEIRKSLEKPKTDEGWTPDKVQKLINDPNFVQAAQSIVNTPQPAEEYMTENEKRLTEQVKHHEAELNEIKKMSFQSFQAQQDVALKSRYANYDPQAVDTITSELLAGKRQATREDLWRAVDYENAVKRAYELGKQDAKKPIEEKTQSMSVEGLTAVRSGNTVEPEKGESNQNYFRRIFLNNLNKQKTEQIRK
jgi:hypothetical protein